MSSEILWRVNKGPLPELEGRAPVACQQELAEKTQLLVEIMYGGLPPAPSAVRFDLICKSDLRLWPDQPKHWSYVGKCEGGAETFTFTSHVYFPEGEGPFPVLIDGDGCWKYMTDEVLQAALAQGCAVLTFNRCEMARDLGGRSSAQSGWNIREGGLYDVYPEGTFGAVAAWAWGIQRAVDLVMDVPYLDSRKIAVSGHSRGGKAALLAGLTDSRITLINDNAAGVGGSAPARMVGEEGESLGDIVNEFPHWFGPDLTRYVDKEETLPFDQHHLLAGLAPRPVLLTYAEYDGWSNPPGVGCSLEAARKLSTQAGIEHHFVMHMRKGYHAHLREDWQALLAFAASYGFGPRY